MIVGSPPWQPTHATAPAPTLKAFMGDDAATGGSLLDNPAIPKIAMVLSAYHGLRRNRGSIGWGLAWGVAGRLFPFLVPALAVAQGFAKEKGCP